MTKSRAREVIEIWPGGAPGSEDWTQQEQETRSQPHGHTFVRNITQPTITVFLPDPAIATGTSAIVCPGGAFHFVTIDNEGTAVAEWLNARGVAAFVLKHRVNATPPDDAAFAADSQKRMTEAPEARERHMAEITRRIAPLAIADAQQAMRIVRGRAAEWALTPERIGMIGFSAGGHLVGSTATNFEKRTYDPIDDIDKVSCRRDFGIMLYSGYFKVKDGLSPTVKAPAGAPPLFFVHATDDKVSDVEHSVEFYLALKRAKVNAELHIYATGGHGFGLNPNTKNQAPVATTWHLRLGEWLTALYRK